MIEQLVLQVSGMTCTGCESRIENVLGRLDGVRSADADHRSDEVRVLFDPKQASAQNIGAVITKAGYEIKSDAEGSR
jgi:copper ion binding protein